MSKPDKKNQRGDSVRSGICRLLDSRKSQSEFLISKYGEDLETQILVHPGSMESDSGNKAWTDGSQVWADHRWPYSAMSQPTYSDKNLTYDPETHVKFVGTTWWNFKTKESIAIGLDIDTEEGHAETTTTVTPEELEVLIEKLLKLPYVTLVRSKSGQGIHIYTFFDEDDLPQADNHSEHAKHAVAVLAKMSDDMDYDMSKHVDAKGSIFWLWASKIGDGGFDLIRDHQCPLGASDLEPYYDSPLATPSSNKNVRIEGYTDSGNKVEESTKGLEIQRFDLDETHKQILKDLEGYDFEAIWIKEHNMLQTHTYALKQLFEDRKQAGTPLKGMFETVSAGNDSKVNCYITPRRNGSFRVTRFGTGVAEHGIWASIDGKTTCYFNQELAIPGLMKKFCAKEGKGRTMTFTTDGLNNALKTLGHKLVLASGKPIKVTLEDDGTYSAASDEWTQDVTLPVVAAVSKDGVVDDASPETLELLDNHIRFVVTEDMLEVGWFLTVKNPLTNKDSWFGPAKEAVVMSRGKNLLGKEAPSAINQAHYNPWILQNVPFREEYPGNRTWNKDAVQFLIDPSPVAGPHPHWDMILDHLGQALAPVIYETDWCRKWGIHCGADYLRYWISCLFRHPFEPLPYLFFFGLQATGKSMFHEMFNFLVTKGVCRGNALFTGSSGFNYEMKDAFLCYIEETDLSRAPKSYDRIKEITTSRTMMIEQKGRTPYSQKNRTHFVQMSNSASACPVETGDQRIVVIEVPPLKNEIAKTVMEGFLEEEAAFFLKTVLDIHLHTPMDRLRLPVLNTEAKQMLGDSNMTEVQDFVTRDTTPCDGSAVKVADLYERYKLDCAERMVQPEDERRFRAGLSPTWIVGNYKNKQLYVANVSFSAVERATKKLTRNNKGRLCQV